MSYYDGAEVLSKKDANGNTPELVIVTTNRTGGKTTYYGRLCVNKFKKKHSKFALIYRFNYELTDCADKFFKDIGSLFFAGDVMTSKSKSKGVYHELYLNDESCGYAFALNSVDQIKRMSHLFSDVDRMIFDEFQSETNHYCPDEVTKFISLHTSIARGQGEQVRFVPVYMLGNNASILNPYFVELGISQRLDDKTRFLKGDGFIVEQGYVESASLAQKESGFNRAFANNIYTRYSSENVYLNDNKAFVERPKGIGRYLVTLRYKGVDYAVREFSEDGIIYCDDKPDLSFKGKITVTLDDHQINYVMLKRNDMFLTQLRWYFEKGCFRFKDMRCKEAILKSLSY